MFLRFTKSFGVATLLLSTCASLASAGSGTSGGGFDYYYTAAGNLSFEIDTLSRLISGVDPTAFNAVVAASDRGAGRKIDQQKLIDIIRNTKSDYVDSPSGIDPSGQAEPKSMSYDLTAGTITALQPFFADFNTQDLSFPNRTELERRLVHEATHLFGFGLTDDTESYYLSNQIMNLVRAYDPSCGAFGTVQQRIGNCQSTASRQGVDRTWAVVTRVAKHVDPQMDLSGEGSYWSDNAIGGFDWMSSNDLHYFKTAYEINQSNDGSETVAILPPQTADGWDGDAEDDVDPRLTMKDLCNRLPQFSAGTHWSLPTAERVEQLFAKHVELIFGLHFQVNVPQGDEACVWTDRKAVVACSNNTTHKAYLRNPSPAGDFIDSIATAFDSNPRDQGYHPLVCVLTSDK